MCKDACYPVTTSQHVLINPARSNLMRGGHLLQRWSRVLLKALRLQRRICSWRQEFPHLCISVSVCGRNEAKTRHIRAGNYCRSLGKLAALHACIRRGRHPRLNIPLLDRASPHARGRASFHPWPALALRPCQQPSHLRPQCTMERILCRNDENASQLSNIRSPIRRNVSCSSRPARALRPNALSAMRSNA